MSHYQHLTIKERESLWEYHIKGISLGNIAQKLNRSKSTLSRELRRNNIKYSPFDAQIRYETIKKRPRRRKLNDPKLKEKVYQLINNQQWSPEQISNRFAIDEYAKISYNTIYRAIKDGIMEPVKRQKNGKYPLQLKLRRKSRSNRCVLPRGKLQVDHKIEERPETAENRTEKGHWEGDTVCISKNTGYIVTLVDRKSRYLLAANQPSLKAPITAETMRYLLYGLPEDKRKTITLDRGSEFFNYHEVEKSANVTIYFSNPHSPWERGSNENTNGLLREYIPKRSQKFIFSEQLLIDSILKINTRPRKCLDWKSPFEIFFDISLHFY
jgi:IS30 family transposase